MKLVDIFAIAKLAKAHQIITVADNTFASPIIQNPIDLGIDIVIHSATKYFGGHSDISAGAVASTQEIMDKIWDLAKDFGGNLSDYTVWLLERSMKTLGIRVKAQQRNAKRLAKYLKKHPAVKAVFYPGLKSNEYHNLAKIQMKGFGAMLSFELEDNYDAEKFLKNLKLIKPSMSLAGVESTMLLPSKTSHSLLSELDRINQGITDQLIRFSVGIETKKDLIDDIEQAISASNSKR
jgi:cystathionine beta-lyase